MKASDMVKFVRIDDEWVNNYLVDHGIITEGYKLKIRGYSIKFSGTQQDQAGLIKYLAKKIKYFVFSQDQIEEMEDEDEEPFLEAVTHFGDVDPAKDGKYGELILFLLVESVLKAPMIAHKLPPQSNPSDQIKGSDGIFFGIYEGESALFIGESKVWEKRSTSIKSSMESIDRFHKDPTKLNYELVIAKRTISKHHSQDELDYLYNVVNPSTSEYRENIKVHPVLICYNKKKISDLEEKCKNKDEGEALMADLMKKELDELTNYIKNVALKEYASLSKVYLDFFFIPVLDVMTLKRALYKTIHGGVEHRPKTEKK